ncbi:MAG: hypothetical protein MRY57_03945 [Candidatus Pacebacteria bacterium]|nr:hypothetical protein [Candidatus Paceibacterota bacterium]
MITQLSKKISWLLLGFVFFAAPIFSHAQGFQLYSADDILVETIPEIPGPNELVKININSFSFNLNNYYIAWFRNGNQEAAGFGTRDFQFRTGGSGEVTNITIVVDFEGQVFRKELRFAPSQIDLLWEATNAYTPPFYKGKALPLKQGAVRVTAIPETLLIEPTDAPNLIYYWDKNYQRQVASSGFGKQSFEFDTEVLGTSEKITVTSNDRRENSFATNTIDIPFGEYEPKILLYEINNDNRLMTNKALNTNNIFTGDTIKLSFHPLHMTSVAENFVDLFVTWRINDQSQPPQNFDRQNELFITTSGQAGQVNLGVELEGIQTLLQKASVNTDLIFQGE